MPICWTGNKKGFEFEEHGCRFELDNSGGVWFTPPGWTIAKELTTIKSHAERLIAGNLAVRAIRGGVPPQMLWKQQVVFAPDDTAGLAGNYGTMIFDRDNHVAIDFRKDSKGYYGLIGSEHGFTLWLHVSDDNWTYDRVREIADSGDIVERLGKVKRTGLKGTVKESDLRD